MTPGCLKYEMSSSVQMSGRAGISQKRQVQPRGQRYSSTCSSGETVLTKCTVYAKEMTSQSIRDTVLFTDPKIKSLLHRLHAENTRQEKLIPEDLVSDQIFAVLSLALELEGSLEPVQRPV
jgi:hypothetical protein